MTDWKKLQEGMEAGEEYKGREMEFATLPRGAWVLVQPITTEDSAWAPELREVKAGTDGERSWEGYWNFSCGLRAIGGDSKCDPTHFGAYTRFKAGINPTDKDPADAIISGKLLGFLNAIFAPGIEGDPARGAASFAVIKAAAEASGMEEDQYDSLARFVAAAARQAIIDGATRQLLVKIGHRKFKTESDQGDQKSGIGVQVQLVEDATDEAMAENKVAIFDNATEAAAESAGQTF
jgi:hypothetical protein